ncbi:vitellogenic carboxypeptidase-like [Bradysia coprophila]|uniref:vitellogenic carboxypeptidase-like n=1 Tax=Bradysia coprophila TaxID=38358 RepID=UPI00187D7500|nr:vitellogenic carboxypeptidase-like [Bradysia coprophila]
MNKFKVLIVLFVAIVAAKCSSESDSSSSEDNVFGNENVNSRTPLFLSRYIQRGKIAEGRFLAEVRQPELLKKKIKSYSGYFTVDERFDSNMFFWFFPAKNNQKNAPLILWLQGGPGASSLYGLFMENGPIYVNKDNTLSEREYPWNENLNLLYIDNPVGAGFSFTNSSDGYLTNQVDVGKNLFSTVSQFLQLFPELRKNEFYISGESYAGKYVPSLAYTIYLNRNSQNPNDRINLKGFAIGNGVTDPINQIAFGELFHNLGFIDANALQIFNQYESNAFALIEQEQYAAALYYTFSLINTRTCLFNNLTGFTSPYNFLIPDGYDETIHIVSNYLVNSSISKYLNVGDRTFVAFDENNPVLGNLANDILASVAPWLEVLIDNYKVHIYSGMLDLLCGPKGIESYLLKLLFNGSDEFRTVPTTQWLVDGEIAGYRREVGNFTYSVVRLAGHMVPHDQPKWAFDLISKLTGTGKKL